MRELEVRSQELRLGRTFGVAFDHGEDFFTALGDFCRASGVRQGYIPMFIAGFAEVEVVGTCTKLENPQAPVWSSVHLTNVEALGGGTIAYDDGDGQILPHIHATVGLKEHSATGHTSHLLSAKIQFLTEMLLVEVKEPAMERQHDPGLYDVPLLRFKPGTTS
jgi:predicted DNA-binding protein with PD1-like motif